MALINQLNLPLPKYQSGGAKGDWCYGRGEWGKKVRVEVGWGNEDTLKRQESIQMFGESTIDAFESRKDLLC